MNTRAVLSTAVVVVALGMPSPGAQVGTVDDARDRLDIDARTRHLTAGLPIYFVPNHGQVRDEATFHARVRGGEVLFTPRDVAFILDALASGTGDQPPPGRPVRVAGDPGADSSPRARRGRPPVRGLRIPPAPRTESSHEEVRLEFVDASAAVEIEGGRLTPALFSYFRGSPERWLTGLPMYEEVVYRDLWSGIDLVYSSNSGRLKYTFRVEPGADPRAIRLVYRGVDRVELDEEGGLRLFTSAAVYRDDRPVAFQEVDGRRLDVPVSFRLGAADDDGEAPFDFVVGAYDPGLPLVIDPPSFVYAGFEGGMGDDRGLGIAVDETGSAVFTGNFRNSDLLEDVDVFVARITPDGGSLVYYSLLSGLLDDHGFDVDLDADGNAYVTGATGSFDFPVTVGPDLTSNGGFDAYASKLSPDGTTLIYSGYLGGAEADFGEGIVVDDAGNAYVEGPTASNEATFPVVVGPDLTYNGGDWDTFIVKVKAVPDDPSVVNNLHYGGYIGGSDVDVFDVDGFISSGHVGIDSAGAAYISGMTKSDESTFPDGDGFGALPGPDQTHNGLYDGYVVKVRPDGKGLAYAGYVGGAADDFPFGMKIDSAGSAYFTGDTESDETTFPVTVGPDLTYNGGDSQGGDAFVVKVNPAGTALEYCGYLGGADVDAGRGVALDPSGSLVVIGYTESSEATFPATQGPDLTFNGSGIDIGDGFIAKLKPVPNEPVVEDNYDYVGYIGGSDNEVAFWVDLDPTGRAYVVGDILSTEATFPDGDGIGDLPGWDQTHHGDSDAYVVCIEPDFNPSEAAREGSLRVAKGAGTAVDLTYATACAATDHAAFLGVAGPGPIGGALQWTDGFCGLGVSGSASFDPGEPPSEQFFYFVVVGQTSSVEGSYGLDSSEVERPEATGVGACDLAQVLSDVCP